MVLFAIPVVWWLVGAGGLALGFQYYRPGGTKDQILDSLKTKPLPPPAVMMQNADDEAKKQLKTAPIADTCVGNCTPPPDDEDKKKRENDPIKDKDKLDRQMRQRGWTPEKVEEAVKSGEKFPAKNFQTGGDATRYVHPTTGQSVIIDNSTGGIIHVGGPGFVY